jgi:predicted aldo/keto reductase-like oxidoreductase
MLMQYREFAGDSCSLLGFGTMRFPTTSEGKINEPEAERMLDAAYAAGVNYFDTANPYHGGESEPFVGRVLSKYPRASYYIATKLPVWKINSVEEALAIFDDQLARLRTDYIDFYLFHALDRKSFQDKVVGLGLIPVFERLQKEGRIRHLGFSFHDNYAAFEEILTYRRWDFCQIQYNYMDTVENPGARGYALAEKNGVPLVIMEPLRGGSLVQFPEDILAAFRRADPSRNAANWALSWLAGHPNIKVILSGMSTMEQIEDNARTLGEFRPLSADNYAAVEEIVRTIRKRVKNGCTACRYCVPCPFGVDIPRAFRNLNEYAMYGSNFERYKQRYLKDGEGLASQCRECGVCEVKCPQRLSVIRDLKEAVATFEKA